MTAKTPSQMIIRFANEINAPEPDFNVLLGVLKFLDLLHSQGKLQMPDGPLPESIELQGVKTVGCIESRCKGMTSFAQRENTHGQMI